MADYNLPGDLILPNPETPKEQDLYTSLQDYTKKITDSLAAISGSTVTSDEKVKASSGDGTADYLDGKVDDSTIEVSGDKLQVKDDGIDKTKINADVAGTGLTQAGDGSLEVVATDTDEIIDADSDTKIQVEESADDDTIRFDAGGTEIVTITTVGMTMGTGSLALASGTTINEFSIDGTLAGDSDDAVPTEKAVKTYVDASASSLSNIAFCFAIGGDFTSQQYGICVDSSITPDAADIQKGCWAVLNTTNRNIIKSKYKHIEGVSTVTFYARVWQSETGAETNTATVTVNIGGQTGTATCSDDQQTPEMLNGTVDVSGLTGGTIYDLYIGLKHNQNEADRAYMDSIIGFMS